MNQICSRLLLAVSLAFPVCAFSQGAGNETSGNAASGQGVVAGKYEAVVQTTDGKLRGNIHNGIYTYKSIPYTKAERFMPPQKPAT